MSDQKKRLLQLGGKQDTSKALPPIFRQSEWEVVRQGKNAADNPDIVADIWDMPAVGTDSMDAVFASHNLELLHAHQIPPALAECLRVLKPGGFAVVSVCDLQAVAAYIADGRLENALYDSSLGPVSPIDLVYGFRKDIGEGKRESHKTGFSAVTLARHLKDAGFMTITVRREWVNLWAIGYKLPEGHPQRRDVPAVENVDITGQKGVEFPWWYRRQLQVQQNPDIRSDNLEEPPQIWKPVGLKRN